MMALLSDRGELSIGEPIKSEGLLGSGQFEGRLKGRVGIGSYDGVIPEVSGQASILGYAKWIVNPADVTGLGFVVS